MIAFNDVENAQHIVIKTDNSSFANANVLYSYILSLHKKVSLVVTEQIDVRFSFLPWFDKAKETLPAKADCIIEAGSDAVALYSELKQYGVSINQKMATALFAALIEMTEGFSNTTSNGTAFAVASELIERKADYVTCKEYLQNREPLSLFRLKSLMYAKMIQSSQAEVVNMYISDEDLQCSGATQKDIDKVMKEVLKMVHVKEVRVYKNNKILKSSKEI